MPAAGHFSDRILAYDHDAILLKTRCMVLEQAGFHVDAATSAEQFQEHIGRANVPYRIFLIGSTVPLTEQSSILDSAFQSSTLVYQLPELMPPQQLIGHLQKLLRRS